MLKAEAEWMGKAIYSLPAQNTFPMLNIGSATQRFREVEQPWLHENLMKPAQEKGYSVIHTDMKADQGVDLVGDFDDPSFVAQLSKLSVKSVLCANLLEHLSEPKGICDVISSLVPVGGYLFVTVPRLYPYHPDPIDTMFRPSVEELKTLFPGFDVEKGEEINCGNYLQQERIPPVLVVLKILARFMLPFYRPKKWLWASVVKFPWMFKDVAVTCVALKKLA